MDITQKIGNNLKKARIEKGFSQYYVSSKIYLGQTQLSRIENGERHVYIETIILLCNLYEITIESLYV